MGRYLIGKDPLDSEVLWTQLYQDVQARGGRLASTALSGVDIALWDLKGKILGQPVYRLLGGAQRRRIRVYANGWYTNPGSPEQNAEEAKKVVEMGYTALKFDPFGQHNYYTISLAEAQLAEDRVAAVREAVGPDVDILVEVHRRLAPMHAIKVAREIEKYNPFWYEEPVLADNLAELAETKRQINIPVVTGEALYTKYGFRVVFERRAADIINPDICNCGGILELKEIAAMAEPYDVVVSPHNYNSVTAGLAASLQICAHIPNFLILEYFVNFTEVGDQVQTNPFKVENGYIRVPTGPGLSVDFDEDALAKFGYQEFPQRRIRTPEDEGP
jgi:galactonate dehydratase